MRILFTFAGGSASDLSSLSPAHTGRRFRLKGNAPVVGLYRSAEARSLPEASTPTRPSTLPSWSSGVFGGAGGMQATRGAPRPNGGDGTNRHWNAPYLLMPNVSAGPYSDGVP